MEISRLVPADDAARAGQIVQTAYAALPDYPHDPEYDEMLGDVAARADEADVVVAVVDGRLGRRRLRIHTLESMRGAQQLYAKLGFERVPELDEDWDGIVGLAYVLHLHRDD